MEILPFTISYGVNRKWNCVKNRLSFVAKQFILKDIVISPIFQGGVFLSRFALGFIVISSHLSIDDPCLSLLFTTTDAF